MRAPANSNSPPAGELRRFLGLDLAWSSRNPSGLAALDECGRIVALRADLRDDDAILAWVREHLAPTCVIGIDMPTIVRNANGARPCERELNRAFRAFDAGTHPANLGLAVFHEGGRARKLLDALHADGVSEDVTLAAGGQGRFAFEVYPHAAHVRLFGLERVFKYKKKRQSWSEAHAAWSRYRESLAALCNAEPPLLLGPEMPGRITLRGRAYKAREDELDALTCAYVASFLWRWGVERPHARVFGDLAHGYIVVPDRLATHPAHAREGKRFSMSTKTTNSQPFLTDLTELRRRARHEMEKGAVTDNYQGDVSQTIDLLQTVLATEIVCVLRYTMHAVAATGIDSESVKEEFQQHASEEQAHMLQIAERINQLGGRPNFSPDGLKTRSASEYGNAENLIDMIKENLIAERIAVEHYRELVRFFGEKDPTTRVMLEGILAQEEEHANDMHDLLVAHEGRPFLKS